MKIDNKSLLKIKPLTKEHLKTIIADEIKLNGPECSLNHIDVSSIEDMSNLFQESPFNGDMSQWDVSRVEYMNGMFNSSPFNGDISKWNVSKVKNMHGMFLYSPLIKISPLGTSQMLKT